ncbi:S8 family serine peptidase [Natrinema salinisoli]|uniref:S8 family serine peptidase n=1 Tax=Natrinema salinisoli TaxID=2878535 RepID=UPI001CF08A93|nr:S8 family serine peptidase [Natrinema salinisoli]
MGAIVGVGSAGSATASGETKELIVGTEDGVGLADVKSTVETALPAGAEIVHENDVLGYATVEIPVTEVGTMNDAASTLESQHGVEYAEENATYYALAQPDDPQFSDQYAPQQVDAPEAWETTEGEDALLAIVDQGVDYEHPDLRDRFGSNVGYDFVDDDGDPMPSSASENHGTHVAGCAAAATDNGRGVAGPSNAQLLSARALGSGGGGSLQAIADAIQWSADQGADVINMSLGGGGSNNLMRDAIDYAYDNGSLPIAAAGNDSGSPVSYPAAYENCVAVAAIDQNYNAASFTNEGPRVDVCAGGVDVLSTVPNGGYEELSGTSMACPVAAGVACLGADANDLTGNDQDPQQLRNLLQDTVEPVDGLRDSVQGDGLVNAANIVGGGGGGSITEGTYWIENVNSGKAIDVLDGGTSDGDDVVQWGYWGGDNQRWDVIENDDGTYRIENVNSGRVLDVIDGGTGDGDDVIQWGWLGGDNQKWVFNEI